MMLGNRMILGLVLFVIASACSGSSNGASTTTEARDDQGDETTEEVEELPINAEVLQEHVWSMQFGGGPLGDVELVDGWPVTIEFGDEVLSGKAACNGYRADYVIDGSRLLMEKLVKTDAGCEAAIVEAERIFWAALRDVDGINLVGDDLALSGPASELLFQPASS